MTQPEAPTPAESTIPSALVHVRGLRLASIVAVGSLWALGAGIVVTLWLSVAQSMLLDRLALLGALLFCEVLFGESLYFIRHERAVVGSAIITLAMVAIVGTFQFYLLAHGGLSILVVALAGACVIPIGLGGVMGNSLLMFIVAGLSSALSLTIFILLPTASHDAADPLSAWISLVIVIVVEALVSVLIFLASKLYDEALIELGAIRRAYEQAQLLDDLKDQFITNVNHELRNPVMALYNYVDLVRMGGESLPPIKRVELLDRAIQAGDRVLQLLRGVLDVRRLEQSASDFTPAIVPVLPTLHSAILLASPRESFDLPRDLHLSVPDSLVIWGDETRLLQILTNLLINAIKYSPPGSPIFVSARNVFELERPQAGRSLVEIRVRDWGYGIPPGLAPLLFHRFVRLPRDLASTTSGSGLGLYLCRVLCEAMGGTIAVESSGLPGEGSTFTVRLPRPTTEISVPFATGKHPRVPGGMKNPPAL
jgi:signal transduction histidine kinase